MSSIVLVTGSSGYLGGRIVRHLQAAGDFEIRGASRASGFDLMSPKSVSSYCAEVDTVIHLAAVNEIQSAKSPELALRVNGLGTLNLLRASMESGVRRFIYFSTAHVY